MRQRGLLARRSQGALWLSAQDRYCRGHANSYEQYGFILPTCRAVVPDASITSQSYIGDSYGVCPRDAEGANSLVIERVLVCHSPEPPLNNS